VVVQVLAVSFRPFFIFSYWVAIFVSFVRIVRLCVNMKNEVCATIKNSANYCYRMSEFFNADALD